MAAVVGFLALSAHLLAAAGWFGAMAYSLAVVQPRSARFLADERRSEAFAVELAAGARYPVLAVIAVLALSGAVLAVDAEAQGTAWWVLVVLKAALLVAATALFAVVSWRLWPRRLFAPAGELPAVRARFRRVAIALTALVAVEIVLGAAAGTLA
jgi:putative copper export protein